MALKVSVIISTHNPNRGRLRRTLEGLARQKLVSHEWELVLVDNASRTPISLEAIDAARQIKNLRVVREERLGLTFGRLAGVRHSNGQLIVLVDDDNVLNADYL